MRIGSRGLLIARIAFLGVVFGLAGGCHKTEVERKADVPTNMWMHDKTFYSQTLGRLVTYRVITPESVAEGHASRVVYLLHGNGGSFREWSESSQIAQLVGQGYVLVMPEGHSSYYIDSATNPKDRYEDFITRDLIADAERNLPVRVRRSDRAIVGISMGGFAAIDLSFKHPDLYGFAAALSPAVDVPERAFSFRQFSKSLAFRSIFGPSGSVTRRANDPYLLARKADPKQVPFMFLSVGKDEPLRGPVERFEAVLRARQIPHQFQELPGGHDWQQWNAELPAMIAAMKQRMGER